MPRYPADHGRKESRRHPGAQRPPIPSATTHANHREPGLRRSGTRSRRAGRSTSRSWLRARGGRAERRPGAGPPVRSTTHAASVVAPGPPRATSGFPSAGRTRCAAANGVPPVGTLIRNADRRPRSNTSAEIGNPPSARPATARSRARTRAPPVKGSWFPASARGTGNAAPAPRANRAERRADRRCGEVGPPRRRSPWTAGREREQRSPAAGVRRRSRAGGGPLARGRSWGRAGPRPGAVRPCRSGVEPAGVTVSSPWTPGTPCDAGAPASARWPARRRGRQPRRRGPGAPRRRACRARAPRCGPAAAT